MIEDDVIASVNDRLRRELGGDIRVVSNLHDQFCIGRVCHNPAHYGEEVIDVQAIPERKALTDGGE